MSKMIFSRAATFLCVIFVAVISCNSQKNVFATDYSPSSANSVPAEPPELQLFRNAYPDVTFDAVYKAEKKDWLVTLSSGDKKTDLFFAGGRFLPEDKLDEQANFFTLLYNYSKEIPDPANFTPEDVERIRNFSAPENRKKSSGSPQFFYDAVYNCTSQAAVEKHIARLNFLGRRVNVHERMKAPLAKVEERIYEAAKTDAEVKSFVDTLSNVDGYYWRTIRDSGKRSFHSIGIAIDVLPKGYGQKNIYWAWRRDIDPQNWMLLPLDRRWMPPLAVINIFEEEGFIWGGKWAIWDNMHFEYHPELVLYRKMQENKG